MPKKLLLAIPPILLLLILVVIAPKIYAQVASGDISILDISIDKGGGKVQSGDITIANTSIGNPTAGAYVVDDVTVVGSGHAYKADYDYEKVPILSELVANAGADGVAAGRYKISGLRNESDQDGQGYYNSLLLQPGFTGSPNDIEIAGAAFVENGRNLQIQLWGFAELLRSADRSKGFVVVYVNENKNINNITKPSVKSCGSDFCKNNYYVYLDGRWYGPYDKNDDNWETDNVSGRGISNRVDVHDLPNRPAFDVRFYKELGDSKEWGTFGFAFSKTEIAGSITSREPQPSSTLQERAGEYLPGPGSVKATSDFYLFSIF